MYPVVVVAHRWQASWPGKDIIIELQEPLEHGWLIVANDVEAVRGLHVMASGADAALEDSATLTPQGHT